MDKRQTNLKKDLEVIKKMTDKELQSFLGEVEQSRFLMIDLMGENHPETQDYTFLLDAAAGELIKRYNKARNSNITKPETPIAPNTFYQLMSLGDGNVCESPLN